MTRHSTNQAVFHEPRHRSPQPAGPDSDHSVRVLFMTIHRLQPPAELSGPRPSPRPRLVQGEILSDESGQLYEKVGQHLRPLQRLFSGPQGEILEFPMEAPPEGRYPSPSAPPASAWMEDMMEEAETPAEAPAAKAPAAKAPADKAPADKHTAAPFTGFAGRPSPIRHPSRHSTGEPRQSHAAIPHASPHPDAVSSRPQPAGPAAMMNGAGAPQPLDRPDRATWAATNGHPFAPQSPAIGRHPSIPAPTPVPIPGVDARIPGSAPAPMSAPMPGSLRRAIPEHWVKYWEFQISREEAIYDLQFLSSGRDSLAAFIRKLTGWFGRRRAWRKWQVLLTGRSLDEQLWAVRPPQGHLVHPAVREWARRTLELAGYDAGAMLPEWEIFWRRKGLQ
jgi:hypothetical protein